MISLLKELSGMRNNYESLAVACNQVWKKDMALYRRRKEIQIADPELIRHGNKYGVKIKANCPSSTSFRQTLRRRLHLIVGSEEQAKDLIDYISQNAKKIRIFDTNIFGKTIRQLVDEGIHSKVNRLTEESQAGEVAGYHTKSGKRFKRRISLFALSYDKLTKSIKSWYSYKRE